MYYSDIIDNVRLKIEISSDEDGGDMYEIYQKGDVYVSTHLTTIYLDKPMDMNEDGTWNLYDGAEYDGDLDWYALDFLKSVFSNIKKI
jgi:hypothetical protein